MTEKTRLEFRLLAPWALLVVFGCGAWQLLPSSWTGSEAARSVYGASASFSGVLVGFVMTGKAILMSLSDDNRVIRWLDDEEIFGRFISYFSSATWWALTWALSALASLAFIDHSDWLAKVGGSIWCGLGMAAMFSFYTLSRYLGQVIRMARG